MTKPSNVIYDMTFANDGKYMSNGATKVLKYKLDAEDANVTVTPDVYKRQYWYRILPQTPLFLRLSMSERTFPYDIFRPR